MTYFARLRLDYIDWRLAVHGEVRRADIMQTFEISESQASGDINQLIAAGSPIQYDKSRKYYVGKRHVPAVRLTKIADALGWD